MKYIFEFISATIIVFFVWNILKRLFFNEFYKNFPSFNPNNQRKNEQQKNKKTVKQKVNWDAETVDFEEVKEEGND